MHGKERGEARVWACYSPSGGSWDVQTLVYKGKEMNARWKLMSSHTRHMTNWQRVATSRPPACWQRRCSVTSTVADAVLIAYA